MPRTFGLQNRNVGGPEDAPPVPLAQAQLRRAAGYFAPYKRQWVVIFACIGANAGLGILPPLVVREILDRAIPQRDGRLLLLLVGAIIVLSIVSGLIGVLQSYVNAIVGENIVFDLRSHLFGHLQRLSLPFYTTTRAGEIVSRVSSDVAAVQGTAAATLVAIASNVLTVAATASILFALNWRLALLALAVVPTLYLPTRFVGRVRRRLSTETQEAQADLLAFLQERINIGGMLLTKLFGQASADAAEFSRYGSRVRALNIRQALAGRWLFLCLSVFSVIGPALIYALGGFQAIQYQLTVGTIIAAVAYLTNLYRPLSNLANVYVDVQGAMGVFARIFEFLDRKPEVEDRPGATDLKTAEGRITFEGVSFVYPPPAVTATGVGGAEADKTQAVPREKRFALRDLTFVIQPGERVALVGPSGAGKTTVTYLLPRFFDPTEGRILLDGHDLRDLSQESLRSHFGMVTQETFLFHSTVRENLLYARPDATEAQLIAAARSANIHDLIAGLPDGYATVVGERAFRLSGGERQRLSIARALLKDPRILILDEATSSLDATSEYLIQQALEILLRGRTSVIVAHRLSTIQSADRILVMDQGRLAESGTHDDLLDRGGLYATLYHRQFRQAPQEPTEVTAPPPLAESRSRGGPY
ncbi:MAG: ABC transporter ATP-binding protein [Cytophagales bacterium]|nr:ABC transporter ATP-binding protein [Armatimonadota bacterium]